MNPADESALELALSLRDTHGGTVTALSMGPERVSHMLRETLSRGVDEAVQLTDSAFAGSDTLATAKALQAAIEALGGFDLILCGRRATDGETGQVGPMLGALLDASTLPNATALTATPEGWEVTQLTEEGSQVWQITLPALITLCEWSYPLRLPTLMGLRRAKTAEIRCLSAADLPKGEWGLQYSPTRVVKVTAKPQGVRPVQKLPAAEVFSRLREGGLL